MNTLILNGTVITCDRARTVIAGGGLAIEGSTIAAVGPSGALRGRFPAFEVIDATGRLVLPGFVNAHTHTVLTVLRGVAEDVTGSSIYGYMVPMALIMSDEERGAMAQLGCLEAIRSGTTTLLETYRFMPGFAAAMVESGLRLVLNESTSDADLSRTRDGTYEYSPAIGEEYVQRGVDLIERWHGAAGGRVTCLMAAHAPDTCSPEHLRKVHDLARKYDVRRTIHLAQSRAEVDFIRGTRGCTPVQYLDRVGFLGPDLIGGHCIFLDEGDIELLAGSGVHVSHNAAINARRGSIAPIPQLSDRGVNIAMGSDNMSEDMVEVVRVGLMVNRIKRGSRTVPQPEDVLEWATLGGARALAREDDLGSLEVGKRADVTIVDATRPHMVPMVNPVSCFVHNAHAGDVETVIVDGNPVMRDGKVLTLDEAEVTRRAQQVTERLWRRFHERYPDTPLPSGLTAARG